MVELGSGMFKPWIESFAYLRALWPSSLKVRGSLRKFKFRFNFIWMHYIYIISWTIVASVIIFPGGGLAYIDALFFTTGAATQAGLNTVNFNALYTYQQVVIYWISQFTNPIFINTFVVFLRLYWFEKRFQHIAREARSFRRTRSQGRSTFTRDQANGEIRDMDREERGVNGRDIHVMIGQQEEAPKDEKGSDADAQGAKTETESGSDKSVGMNGEKMSGALNEENRIQRGITFADEVQKGPAGQDTNDGNDTNDANDMRLPERIQTNQHIAFLEDQRRPREGGPLRIPGPRDVERGLGPRRVFTDEIENANDPNSPAVARRRSSLSMNTELNQDDHVGQDRRSSDGSLKRNFKAMQATMSHFNPSRLFRRHDKRDAASKGDEPSNANGGNQRIARSFSFASGLGGRTWSQEHDPIPYLSYEPTVGRNSMFVDLTEDQREELGGVEYRSLKTLAAVLVCYFVGFHIFAIVSLTPWILHVHWGEVVEADGQGRPWWGIYTAQSMFNDVGFTLTPDSMESFQLAVWPLLVGCFLIVIGNTGFPCMLRFVIWLCSKFCPIGSAVWEEFRFLLDHPRRVFILLFPSDATWWLFWILVLLNGIDLVFFIILNLNNPTVTSLPPGFRVLDGLFQAISTRTAGFACVNLADLHPAIQVSYMIMMYISVFPIAISVRRTNVYEENSLGLYGGSDEEEQEASYLGSHLRRQLSFDLWYLFLGFFIIAVVEGDRLQDPNDPSFSLFAVLFEIVSAYGTVGMSLGYPTNDESLSAEFHTISKLVVIAMMIRGRHRGLPYALDRAILLPSDSLHRREVEAAAARSMRRASAASLNARRHSSAIQSPTGVDADHIQALRLAEQRNASLVNTPVKRKTGFGRLLSNALSAGPTFDKRRD